MSRRGKLVAAVEPIRPLGRFAVSHDPEFIETINRSWEGYKKTGGTSLEELRETYGLVAKPRKRARRAR